MADASWLGKRLKHAYKYLLRKDPLSIAGRENTISSVLREREIVYCASCVTEPITAIAHGWVFHFIVLVVNSAWSQILWILGLHSSHLFSCALDGYM